MRHKYDTQQPSAPAPPVDKPPAKVMKSIVKNTNSKVKSKKAVSKEASKASKESAASSTVTALPTPPAPVSVPVETPATVLQESPGSKVSIYPYSGGTDKILFIIRILQSTFSCPDMFRFVTTCRGPIRKETNDTCFSTYFQ